MCLFVDNVNTNKNSKISSSKFNHSGLIFIGTLLSNLHRIHHKTKISNTW